MPATASGSSLVTRTRADHASWHAAPGRPFRVGSDGLPLLPCHDAPVIVAPVSNAPPPAVALFGHVDSTQDVRDQLVARYGRSQQLGHVSEMTLRIDTELELLRRSCFAQRNAQWGGVTPDQFEFRPVPSDVWTPQPANDKLLLRKMKLDGSLDGSGKEFYYSPDTNRDKELEAVEFVRDRPWPPREFTLKPVTKTARGRGGKRKAAPMAAVLDPVPLLSKTCRQCKTQSTPLWRTQTRTVKVKKQVATNVATSLANAFVAQNMAKMNPQKTEVKMEEVEEKVEVDLCLQCYLKLERADLFDKKRIEKKREERRKKDQAGAVAFLEKKRLKHQIHLLKKQQKEHKKQGVLAAAGELVEEQIQEGVAAPAPVILKFTREEIEAATGSSKERKKDRKHSRKDRKKKKKKHRRKQEHEQESESDGPTPIPSPAQVNGYVYADRTPEPYSTPQVSAFEGDQAHATRHMEAMMVNTEPETLDSSSHGDEEMSTLARSSSRKRKSAQYAEPAILVESPALASKKRKTSSSRTPRSKRPAASATAAVAVSPAPSAKKRARTKKELARERELRALGQYCPVCNETYEDDDQSTFVCCDSCELWVHGACDPSLTPEIIAAMANTEDKYICPLCAGR